MMDDLANTVRGRYEPHGKVCRASAQDLILKER